MTPVLQITSFRSREPQSQRSRPARWVGRAAQVGEPARLIAVVGTTQLGGGKLRQYVEQARVSAARVAAARMCISLGRRPPQSPESLA